MFLSLVAVAQKQTVTGTVIEQNGVPIIGASVLEIGTTNGTVTDLDGKFTLQVDQNATLQISYIGFTTQIIEIKGQTNFDVNLKEDSELLSEVVVTG